MFITAAVAVLQIGAAEWLSPWLGIASSLLRYSGIALLIFVGFLGYCIIHRKFNRRELSIIIAVNGLWAMDCLIFMYAERFELTSFGMAFVLIQVIAVAAFAVLEYLGLKMPIRKESQV